MEVDVADYVQSCLTCSKFKVSSSKKKGKLIPLEVPFDCIQVAVDLLSKRAKYAPMYSTATAAYCARVFFDSVVQHHGLPEQIEQNCERSGRVARHPSAPTNRALKSQRTKAEFAQQFAERSYQIVEQDQQALLDAKQKQKEYYDKRRAEPDFKAGNWVLLKTEKLSLKHVAHNTELTKAKLAARLFIINKIVARLKFPSRFRRVHPSFNVDLLTPYPEQHKRFRSRPKSTETSMGFPDDDNDGMRIVERLVTKRQFNRKPEYLVKWLGEPMSECTWEWEKDVKHVAHLQRLWYTWQCHRPSS
ncbi:hypothetical protein PHMEG_00023483 [Phytophthora megakarya]|uniref:Chromo domain-containing protein n=1 Tax=Phytophthora megakarya TaxID=4795 RepID=A0A225VIB0_9STRA|nr:hypothetical protein PHMEG_00023483 [Phytophthora megakarya]